MRIAEALQPPGFYDGEGHRIPVLTRKITLPRQTMLPQELGIYAVIVECLRGLVILDAAEMVKAGKAVVESFRGSNGRTEDLIVGIVELP